VGSGGQRKDVSNSGVTGIAPHMTRLFGTVTPEPDTTLTLSPTGLTAVNRPGSRDCSGYWVMASTAVVV
jgi:hypothetical protein